MNAGSIDAPPPGMDEPVEPMGEEHPEARHLQRDAIDRALAALPGDQREAVLLRDVEGLTAEGYERPTIPVGLRSLGAAIQSALDRLAAIRAERQQRTEPDELGPQNLGFIAVELGGNPRFLKRGRGRQGAKLAHHRARNRKSPRNIAHLGQGRFLRRADVNEKRDEN